MMLHQLYINGSTLSTTPEVKTNITEQTKESTLQSNLLLIS